MARRFEQELTETTEVESGGSYSLLPPFPPVLCRVAEHVTESVSRWGGRVLFCHVEQTGCRQRRDRASVAPCLSRNVRHD